MSTPLQKHHFESLDGLRGVAAALVLFAHACSIFTPEHNPILWHKHLAVYFFFMLSGFVIARAYERKLRDGFGIIKFAVLRLIRLYPLVISGAILSSAFLYLFDPTFAPDPSLIRMIALASACLPARQVQFGAGLFPVNPPEWSLFFELVAYAVFAVFVPKLRTAHLFVITFLCFLAWSWSSLEFSHGQIPFWTNSFSALATFLLGIVLWRTRTLTVGKIRAAPFLVLALGLLCICALPASLPRIFEVAIAAFILPCVILSASAKPSQGNPAMKLLGDLSYPVYILHWGVLQAFLYLMRPTFGLAATVTCSMATAICVAWVLLRFFDVPLRAILDGYVKSTRRPTDGAVAIPPA